MRDLTLEEQIAIHPGPNAADFRGYGLVVKFGGCGLERRSQVATGGVRVIGAHFGHSHRWKRGGPNRSPDQIWVVARGAAVVHFEVDACGIRLTTSIAIDSVVPMTSRRYHCG